MHTVLADIIAAKKESITLCKKALPIEQLKKMVRTDVKAGTQRRNFRAALAGTDKVHIIAEIKKASPSVGLIAQEFDPARIAQVYTQAGASAISVLTEEKHFQGKLEYLQLVRNNTTLPILRKDFILDPYQIYESKAFGADAILLIAAVLDVSNLQGMAALASSMGLDCIAEVHSEEDLKKVLSIPFEIIGINNRDLNDFSVALTTSRKIVSSIPQGRTIIAESGIKTAMDITTLRAIGIHAFLIGETLMRSSDITKTMKRFMNA